MQLDVQVVATKSALHFFEPSALPVKCHIDEEEWVRACRQERTTSLDLLSQGTIYDDTHCGSVGFPETRYLFEVA